MKREKMMGQFKAFVDDLFLPERAKIISHEELMGQFKNALNNDEISADSPLKTNFDFWKNKALNPNQYEGERIAYTQARSTLDNILHTYFVGDSYADYAKYLAPNGFLFSDMLKKEDDNDPELPRIMCVMISFFDRVSKLPLEEQKKLLAQFPMQNENEYRCAGGTQTRLSQVSLQMDNYLIQSCENIVSGSSSELLRFINEGNQVHLPALLQKSLGLNPNDNLWHAASSQVSAGDVWEFVKYFNDGLSSNLELQLNPQREAIKAIAKAFDDVFECASFTDQIWMQFESKISSHFAILGIADKAYLSEFLKNNNIIIQVTDPGDEREFYFNPEAIKQKLEELAEKSNIKTTPQENEILQFNLHDANAPEKIVGILKDPNSTPYQKHLAITALWILSQDFAGNSPDNFFETLHVLGENGTVDERLNQATTFLSSAQFQENNLAQEIIGRVQSNKTKYPFYQKIFDNSLSVLENIQLRIPQDFLARFDKNAQVGEEDRVAFSVFWRELLNQASQDEQGNIYEDWAEIIFYHPSRDKIFELVKAKQNELGEQRLGFANVELNLLQFGLYKQDVNFLRTLFTTELVLERKIRNAYHLMNYAFQDKNKAIQSLVIEILGGINQVHNNQTLLKIAIEKEDLKMTEFLIENGADILSPIEDGKTAFSFAVAKESLDLVGLLLQKLFDDILMKDEQKLENIKNNIIGVKDGILITDEKGNAAEIWQILNGSSDIFPALRALKENQNSAESILESKLAILNFAVQNNYPNLAKSVIDLDRHSNNPQIQQEHIQNAFFLAVEHNNKNVFDYFLTQNVNINGQNQDGDSPLMISCKIKILSNITSVLLKAPNINLVATNNAGENFLHIALNNVDFMLEFIFYDLTKLQLPQETVDDLMNQQGMSGNTPLHYAIGKDVGMLNLKTLLTDANFNVANRLGETPFILAVKNNLLFSFAKTIFDKLSPVDQINALNAAFTRNDPDLKLGVLNFIDSGYLPQPTLKHPQANQLAPNQEELAVTPPSSPKVAANNPPPHAKRGSTMSRTTTSVDFDSIVEKVKSSYGDAPGTVALITNITQTQNANPRNAGQE